MHTKNQNSTPSHCPATLCLQNACKTLMILCGFAGVKASSHIKKEKKHARKEANHVVCNAGYSGSVSLSAWSIPPYISTFGDCCLYFWQHQALQKTETAGTRPSPSPCWICPSSWWRRWWPPSGRGTRRPRKRLGQPALSCAPPSMWLFPVSR